MLDLFGALILKTCAHLPLSLLHRIANWLGRRLAKKRDRHTLVAQTNIARCLPELSPEQQQRLLQESLIGTFATLLESTHIWLGKQELMAAMVQETHGQDRVAAALEKGKGVILVSPHLGNWELVGAYCATQYPMTSMYKPARRAWLDKIIYQGRARHGQKMAPTDVSGIKIMLQALKRNEVIGILPDQDPRERGVFAPFFGVQANTMTLLSKLAQKSGAAVLMAYSERLPDNRGFAIHFEHAPEAVANPDVEVSVRAVNAMVEQAVRRKPEQYQWSYKRFLTRPEGEDEAFYPKKKG